MTGGLCIEQIPCFNSNSQLINTLAILYYFSGKKVISNDCPSHIKLPIGDKGRSCSLYSSDAAELRSQIALRLNNLKKYKF